jgi:hypothetical protein
MNLRKRLLLAILAATVLLATFAVAATATRPSIATDADGNVCEL